MTALAKILIVEDDPVSRKILCESLSRLKHEVHSAHNGIDALEKLGDDKYDLILLDVMMPGLSGYELLKRIRLKLSPEELPVILVTAKSQLDDIHAGFKAGANDYIIKPFSMDELSIRVENMLKLKKVFPPEEPGLVIKEKGSIRIIQYRKIIYLSSIGKRTVIHTTEHDETVSMMLKDFEIKLPGSFVRIHKQHIIHSLYLSGVVHIGSGRYEAILNDADDTRLVVGRSFVADIKEYIDDKGRNNDFMGAVPVAGNAPSD
jgi:DNA-binding response OmpR family regulator